MTRIDKINRKLLFELDKNARIPEAKLAKLVNKSKDTVRYRISQLEKEGIIRGYRTWIDLTKLGYVSYKMYLKLSATSEQLEKMKEFLRQERSCFAIFTADGAWTLGLAFFAKNHEEFYEIQNRLRGKFDNLIISKTNCNMVDAIVGSQDFLCEGTQEYPIYWSIPENNDLDDIEKKMLRLLFYDARMSLVDLAVKCKTTVDKIRTRLKRLEDKKIIFQYKAIIDFNKLKYEFYKSFVFLKNYGVGEEKKLFGYLKKNKNIINILRMLGPWTLELEIMVENYHEYNKIIRELRNKFPEIVVDIESAIMNEIEIFPSKKMIFED